MESPEKRLRMRRPTLAAIEDLLVQAPVKKILSFNPGCLSSVTFFRLLARPPAAAGGS